MASLGRFLERIGSYDGAGLTKDDRRWLMGWGYQLWLDLLGQ